MHELDLIPDDYRELQQSRALCKIFAIVFTCVFLAVGAAKFTLSKQLDQVEVQITSFENGKSLLEQQHQELIQLQAKKGLLENRVSILHKLRNGPPARQMFVVMDKVLDEGTWFKSWSFMRAGEFQEILPEEKDTGYFVIVQDDKLKNKNRAWKQNTHMELAGQALDHTYLARFVNRLIEQPEIEDVKVLKTSTQARAGRDIIQFNLAVTVNNNYGY